MDLTPKQQTSEAIRQAETILITTGQHPSVDQVSAVIGLSMILRKFGKKVSAVISDTLPQSVQMLDSGALDRNLSGLRDFVLKLDVSRAEVDKLRYEVLDGKLNIFITPFKGAFAPSDVTFDYGESHFEYDLAIVLGVPTRARIDRIYEQNQTMFATIPVVNLDFHRSNESYGAVNLIEPNASSLCEMLVALSESLQGGIIDAEIATALLMGIIASTDRFTAAHTTSKSLTVAAQMMAAGARQPAVVRALYRDGKGGGDQSRGERGGGDQNRGGDRGGSERPPREAQRDREPQREAQREPVRPALQPTAAPEVQPARQPAPEARPERQPLAEAPAYVAPQPARQPEPVAEEPVAPLSELPEAGDNDLPIIQPGHIEFNEPEETPAPRVSPDAPTMTLPMADFAAAAEVLNPRQTQPASADQSENQSA